MCIQNKRFSPFSLAEQIRLFLISHSLWCRKLAWKFWAWALLGNSNPFHRFHVVKWTCGVPVNEDFWNLVCWQIVRRKLLPVSMHVSFHPSHGILFSCGRNTPVQRAGKKGKKGREEKKKLHVSFIFLACWIITKNENSHMFVLAHCNFFMNIFCSDPLPIFLWRCSFTFWYLFPKLNSFLSHFIF